ncbi:unnamed protein product [Clonostachys byssicola]|uniref:Uncharacterized protein n=1 Tax=Clonostachys byssicola TaxID=160290 RepID=A0A9N9U8Q2_9HYPO|nr:unnamed protein product [Clonostachys byssicola]
MGKPIDFSTYRFYNIISKTFIDDKRLDEVIKEFDSKRVHVVRVNKEEIVAGFMKHNFRTDKFILKNDCDYHFTVSPAPVLIVTPATKNTPNGHYHDSYYGWPRGDNKGDKKNGK